MQALLLGREGRHKEALRILALSVIPSSAQTPSLPIPSMLSHIQRLSSSSLFLSSLACREVGDIEAAERYCLDLGLPSALME